MIKTQIITLDKLAKFLRARERKIVTIIPHTYEFNVTASNGLDKQTLKSVLIIYMET